MNDGSVCRPRSGRRGNWTYEYLTLVEAFGGSAAGSTTIPSSTSARRRRRAKHVSIRTFDPPDQQPFHPLREVTVRLLGGTGRQLDTDQRVPGGLRR
jgi:hypothetical protein